MANQILLCGGTGRMGRAIEAYLSEKQNELTIGDKISRDSQASLKSLLLKNNLIIDFSLPELTEKLLTTLKAHQIYKPLLIGTTGLTESSHQLIDQLSKKMPILQDTNMSPGIHFLNHVIQQAPHYFDSTYDIDLYDRHHHHKIDSPSGTLKKLLATLEASYGYQDAAYSPNPNLKEKRPDHKIGIAVERSGNVFGEHRVSFVSENEEIQLFHKAFNRKLFAKGAILALNWLKNQPIGRYSMSNVFN